MKFLSRCLLCYLLATVFELGIAPYVHGKDTDTCGPECLYIALNVLKPDFAVGSFEEFSRRVPKSESGQYSMLTLESIAKEFGLIAEVRRIEADDLEWFCENGLVILRLTFEDRNHFVLCEKANGPSFVVFDAGRRRSLGISDLQSQWSGECVVLSAKSISDSPPGNWLFLLLAVPVIVAVLGICYWGIGSRWRAAMLVVLAAVWPLGCQRNAPPAKIGVSKSLAVVGSDTIDLGTIVPGHEPRVANFTLRNDTNRTIDIKEVRTSCSCAMATSSINAVAAGETCEIQIYVNPERATSGNASISVIADNRELKLKAIWRLGVPFRTSLDEFPILDLSVGESGMQTILIKGDGLRSAMVESFLEKQMDGIEHRAHLQDEACYVDINVHDSVSPNIYFGHVRITPILEPSLAITIPWTLRVSAPLVATPNELFFFAVDEEMWKTEVIVDFAKPGFAEKFQVEPVPANIDSFDFTTESTGDQGCVSVFFVSQDDLPLLQGVRLSVGSEYSIVFPIRY